jgi:uncharacterized protein YlaI
MECKKVSFINEQYALDYIEILRKTSKRYVKPIRAYLCEECNKWHLTHFQMKDLSGMERHIKKIEEANSALKEKILKMEQTINNQKETISCLNEAIVKFRTGMFSKPKKFKQLKSK